MSHRSEIKTRLDSLFYIQKGLEEMNIKFKMAEEGQKLHTKGHYNQVAEVDVLVTEVNGQKTDAIGLVKESNGTYTAVGDFYGIYNKEEFVADLTAKAKQCEVTDRLGQLNFTLDQVENQKQELSLTFSRWV